MRIGDSLEVRDYKRELIERRKKKKIAKIVLIVMVIIIGILTYFIVNSVVEKNNKNEVNEPEDQVLSIDNDNVSILYQYVTYENDGTIYDKFVSNKEVTLNDFKTEEKYYYALQFVQVEDFSSTGEKDTNNNKIYFISNRKIKEYMSLFFGPNVTYSTNMKIVYSFSFKINGMNIGTMTYNEEEDGFYTIFDSKSEIKEQDTALPFYTEIDSAVMKPDGRIVIKEKVLYSKVVSVGDKYKIDLYKDPDFGILVQNINDIEKSDLAKYRIDIDKMNNTGFIEYTFALDNENKYYFESSKYTQE